MNCCTCAISGRGLDLPWQQSFGTDEPAEVERMCAARGIECAWRTDDDGELLLRTRERCWPSRAIRAPVTACGSTRRTCFTCRRSTTTCRKRSSTRSAENVPRNVYYGDGEPLEADALAEIRGVLDQQRIVFPWRTGDVLMLDNMLTAHARDPFEGPRKVVVAMAQSYTVPRGRTED